MPKTASSNFISSSNYRQLPVQILSLPRTFPSFLTLKIGQKNLRHPAEKSLKTNGKTRGHLIFCQLQAQSPTALFFSLLSTSQKTTKQRHHGPPSPPAPGGSNSTGERDRPTSRDRSQSLRSSYVTFIDESNKSFILLTILLCAEARRALGQKVSF